MMPFKQMICEFLYGNHLLGKGSVFQLGYDSDTCQWIYIVYCVRCGKMSIMDRRKLDTMMFKQEDKD